MSHRRNMGIFLSNARLAEIREEQNRRKERQKKEQQEKIRKALEKKERQERLRREAEEKARKEAERKRLEEIERARKEEEARKKRVCALSEQLAEIKKLYDKLTGVDSNNFVSNDEKEISRQISEYSARVYWLEKIEKEFINMDCTNIPAKLAFEINKIRSDFKNVKSYSELQLFYTDKLPKYKNKIKDANSRFDEIKRIYNEVYSDYSALCSSCNVKEESFDLSDDGISAMNREIIQLKDMQQKEMVNEAINNTINEVFEELGLEVLASKVVENNNGSVYQKILVQYYEDKAVDVTVTNDGQLIMEIGLMDNEKRQPNSKEAEEIREEAANFCEDAKLIEEKFKEKGLILTSPTILPPNVAYSEIINISDYDLEIDNSCNNSDQDVYSNIRNHNYSSSHSSAKMIKGDM